MLPDPNLELSVVIPFYNEGSNIDCLFERLFCALDRLEVNYEIICVNDGSKDNTLDGLLQQHHSNRLVKVVNLSRNFGKELALTAGLDYTSGAAIVPLDADLQDPPELIQEMMEKWREGYDVVYATRRSRQGESWLKRLTAALFYSVMGSIGDVPIPHNTGDFRLLDRHVVDVIKQMPERTRFMKGLFAWVGFKQTCIVYDRPGRHSGLTSWNYWRLWNFALDGITSFSLLPLKVWSYLGFLLSIVAFIYATFLIIRTLLFGIDVPGYASLMVVILFLGGMQFMTLGIIGEYLGRIFEEVKGRPLYLVRDLHGFEPPSSLHASPSQPKRYTEFNS
ncbi:glycosyltransferase family 2 protein [Myxacorys almedinensis]|uniref:Glycosyltransferase n=1 Tax=Myxacorys almedinensis A TaxID=2690445 RepID=A0A8J7ZCX5_9CYAN|nr:glycosyltransferase family 2 protein [Myxacorys almedinensis]NDJ19725.1 glycosyltransferase [Myxacorys almedinensis A]